MAGAPTNIIHAHTLALGQPPPELSASKGLGGNTRWAETWDGDCDFRRGRQPQYGLSLVADSECDYDLLQCSSRLVACQSWRAWTQVLAQQCSKQCDSSTIG